MLMTLDSVFKNDNQDNYIYTVFHFIDIYNLHSSSNIISNHIAKILSKKKIRTITIRYDGSAVNSDSYDCNEKIFKITNEYKNDILMSFNELRNFYNRINNSRENSGKSKVYGESFKDDSHTDVYLTNIISDVFNVVYEDDNGKPLIKKLLKNSDTHGFDVDLIEPNSWTILEFLHNKLHNENINFKNIDSHPMRYLKNKRKFQSLWNFSKLYNGTLYLVNYSDDDLNPEIIEVIEYDYKSGKFKLDIGYDISKEDYLKWIKLLNKNQNAAKVFLDNNSKKQIRDEDFWDNWEKNGRKMFSTYEWK